MLLKELFENINPPLIAPNGKKSNLNSVQYQMVRTKEFKNWFGDWENNPTSASKVVDENGEPLVVYHGTNTDFHTFDYKRAGAGNDTGMRGRGFYFSPNSKTSGSYGNIIKAVFLSIKHPFKPSDFSSAEEIADKLGIDDGTFEFDSNSGQFRVYSSYAGMLTGQLKDANYDGVIYPPGQEIVAFYPNQIKSAIGNSGNFFTDSLSIHEGITKCY